MNISELKERQRKANSAPKAIERRRKYRESAHAKEKARQRRLSSEGLHLERENSRKRRYGLKSGEWDVMFEKQGFKCAICSASEHGGKYWHTDHCHSSGKVRGILCHPCNHMVGWARDKISSLISAIAYLELSKEGCEPFGRAS